MASCFGIIFMLLLLLLFPLLHIQTNFLVQTIVCRSVFLFIFNVINHELPLSFITSHVDGRTNVWKCLVQAKQKAEKTFPDWEELSCSSKSFWNALDFFHLVENQLCENVPSSYRLGLPASVLLRWNSGEVYAPALISFLRSHQRNPVILPPQQSPESIKTTLNWRVPFCLWRLVCGFGSRWSRPDGFLCFFRNLHHSIFGFL